MMGPLKGINILDMGTAGVGPWAATLLAMLDANVIKVEPPFGDALRMQPPYMGDMATAYAFCNIGKRCLVLDLKDKTSEGVIERLVTEADVIMQNLRPGVMDRLGLGYEAVRKINPSIVYVECSAWGFEGEMRNLPGVAGVADAFGGFWSLSGDPGGRPERLRYPYTDFNASSYIAAATLLGLYACERTGQSQRVQLSQLGNTLAAEVDRIAEYFVTRQEPLPLGHASGNTAPHQAFLCQDRQYLAAGVETGEQWKGLCKALGIEDLSVDPRFASNVDRVNRREELASILQEVFLTKSARWWAIRLGKEGVPYGYFYDFETLRNHPQVLESGFMPTIEQPQMGRLYTGGIPWRLSRTPAHLGTAPLPGKDTEEITRNGFGSQGAKPKKEAFPHKGDAPPLSGVKVVDMSQGVCGPYTSLLMALSGADVIKVEPLQGDYARSFAPRGPSGDGAVFLQLNQNKKSMVLDIENPEGRERLRSLVQGADVFIEDLGPGRADALGLGPKELEVLNPGLVYCAITPFGERGPMKDMPGSELVIQAISDACVYRSLGGPDAPPVRVGSDIASLSTGLMAFQGIMAALLHRERTGSGQRVAVSLLGSLLSIWGALWMALTDPDEWYGLYCDNEAGPRMYGLRTKDRDVHFSAPTLARKGAEEEFITFLRELAEELQIKELTEHPLLSEPDQDPVRVAGLLRQEVQLDTALWEKYFKTMTAKEVIERTFRGPTITVPIHNLAEVLSHPQTQTLGMISTLQLNDGQQVEVLGLPWKGSWGGVKPTPLS